MCSQYVIAEPEYYINLNLSAASPLFAYILITISRCVFLSQSHGYVGFHGADGLFMKTVKVVFAFLLR